MTDIECEYAFSELERVMNQEGLAWVTTQVAEEVRFGKTVVKKVTAFADTREDVVVAGSQETRRKSKVEVSATRLYTAREKLDLLLTALEQATVATSVMENQVRKRLTKTVKEWTALYLVRSDDSTRLPIVIGPVAEEAQSLHIKELGRLLKLFREMM
jgi:hypothetical protein